MRVADLLERCQPHMQPNYRFNSDILGEFKDPNIRLRVAFEISRIAMLEEMIEECNAEIQKQCKDQDLQNHSWLRPRSLCGYLHGNRHHAAFYVGRTIKVPPK